MMTPQTHREERDTILALSSGTRSIGVAVVDPLGITDARIRLLHSDLSRGRWLFGLNDWVMALVDRFEPEHIILDGLSSRRSGPRNQMLHGYLRAALNAHHTGPIRELHRKEAIDWLCQSHTRGGETTPSSIRRAARILAENWQQQFLQQIPSKPYRTNWDRTWGQAVVAMTLALHARHIKHESHPSQQKLPLERCSGP